MAEIRQVLVVDTQQVEGAVTIEEIIYDDEGTEVEWGACSRILGVVDLWQDNWEETAQKIAGVRSNAAWQVTETEYILPL